MHAKSYKNLSECFICPSQGKQPFWNTFVVSIMPDAKRNLLYETNTAFALSDNPGVVR